MIRILWVLLQWGGGGGRNAELAQAHVHRKIIWQGLMITSIQHPQKVECMKIS